MFFYIFVKSLTSTVLNVGMAIQMFGPSGLLKGMFPFWSIIIVLLLWMFTKRNAIANKLFKDEGDIDVDKSITFPLAVNLVCIFAGLIVLSDAILSLISVIFVYLPACYKNTNDPSINIWQFVPLFPLVVKFAIGLYLVYGAPHFVRWQIRRIKKLTEETVE
jgi:hypothetical protein